MGNEKNGLSEVIDNYLNIPCIIVLGVPNATPLPPLAADPTPYFDNYCIYLRLAGFGVNLNLQRPFPSFSLPAMLELLAALSDPSMPINPTGDLANSMRVSVTDAYITLPEPVTRMFPQISARLDRPLNYTLNLANFQNFFAATYKFLSNFGRIVKTSLETTQSVSVSDQIHGLTRPDRDALLGLLPPELRKFNANVSFAGFQGQATVALITRAGAESELKQLRAKPKTHFALNDPAANVADLDVATSPESVVLPIPRPPQPPRPRPEPPSGAGIPAEPPPIQSPNLPALPGGLPIYDPNVPSNSLLADPDFTDFTVNDWQAIPTDQTLTSVVIAAKVKLPLPGQQIVGFSGFVYEDGSFKLLTGLSSATPQLQLQVGDIFVALPFQVAANTQVELQGKVGWNGSASIIAKGSFTWVITDHVLTLAVNHADLSVSSSGDFAVCGGLTLSLLDGRVILQGWVSLDQNHCFVQGTLHYLHMAKDGQELIDLTLNCQGQIGPIYALYPDQTTKIPVVAGRLFELSGSGSLKILDQTLTEVTGVVSDTGVLIEARLSQWTMPKGGLLPNCILDMTLKGAINFSTYDVTLEGAATLQILGATIQGRGGIAIKSGLLSAFVEGDLQWHEGSWLRGRIDLSENDQAAVTISGRTALVSNIAPLPQDWPKATTIPQWVVKLDLETQFTFDLTGRLVSLELHGDWLLGLVLPKGDSEHPQALPLATQRIDFTVDPEKSKDDEFIIPLVRVRAFPIPQLDGSVAMIPVIVASDDPNDYLVIPKLNGVDAGNLGVSFETRSINVGSVGFDLPTKADITGGPHLKWDEKPLFRVPKQWILKWLDNIGKQHDQMQLPFTQFQDFEVTLRCNAQGFYPEVKALK